VSDEEGQRRPYGSGSIYRRREGLWAAEITLRRGRERVRRRWYGRTPAEAEVKMDRYLESMPKGMRLNHQKALRQRVNGTPTPAPFVPTQQHQPKTVEAPALPPGGVVHPIRIVPTPALRWQDAEWLEKLAATFEAGVNAAGQVVVESELALRIVVELRDVIRRNRPAGVSWMRTK
jgi:hypothetical protein